MFKRFLPIAVVMGLASAPAFGACPNQVGTVSVQAGGAIVHVTANDQTCTPMLPANVTATLSAGLIGIVTVSPDATGWNLSVPNINQPAISGGTLNLKNTNNVSVTIGLNVTPGGVTAMEVTSP